ncbi:diguanylate cyclase/phosphodiesterase [Agrobacterium vitis]|nr:diguanylate cyclase/phosphodiesterase [Agrobacterium vitis]
MLTAFQNMILEKIAKGDGLDDTLDCLCRAVEDMVPDIVTSVLSLDDNCCLHHLAGPSIAASYATAIDGLRIAEGMGSCGTAASRGSAVLVESIATHPFWAAFKDLALPFGFKACWSTPIISNGKVLGTFAFYFFRERGPSDFEKQIVAACVHLCAIGMDRELRSIERRRISQTDALTGLPNRSRFNEMIALEDAAKRHWGLLLMDLDDLKLVNDTFGHLAGDDLIASVGRRLHSLCGADSAFRLGGDEFAVIVRGDECVDLGFFASHILDCLKAPCLCAGQTIYPSGTIGGAVAVVGESIAEIRQNADFALYEAKDRARGQFVEYSRNSGSRFARRFGAFQLLADALREGRVDAHYQPIVDLRTGRILGLEALCRVTNRKGEVISASHFHEATRDANLAAELTRRILKIVVTDARRWMDLGLDFGRVGLNVSAGDFLDGRLSENIVGVLENAGVPTNKIVIELTESIYIGRQEQSVVSQIAKLRKAGMEVALDDFGTGFASLTHLVTIPLDIIKIDRLFVERMILDRSASVIVEALLSISEKLNFKVIAEGIETREQRDFLSSLGCLCGQGFLFSKAVDREQATLLLRDQADKNAIVPMLRVAH